MPQNSSHVVFFSAKDPQEKLSKLCTIVQKHFQECNPLLLVMADVRAQDFVDELLWRMPPESFIPHASSNMPCKDIIAITSSSQNINQAKTIFNLTSFPLLWTEEPVTIYEFEEHFSPQKRQATENRYQAYREKGLPIRMEDLRTP